MPYSSPLSGGLISAENINVTQSGSRLLTASLISQRAGFNPWFALPGSGSITATIAPVQNSSVPGGLVWSFTSPTSGGTAIYTMGPLIPVDTARTYLGKIWASRVSGDATGRLSAGYIAYNSSGTQLTGNGGSGGSYGYFMALAANPSPANFYSGWVTGTGPNTGSNTTFPAGTAYVQMILVIVGGATQWNYLVTVPEFWEGPGYNGGAVGASTVAPSLWIPSSLQFNVGYNVDYPIAASGSGWVFIGVQGLLKSQIYAVDGASNPLGFVSGTGWVNGGVVPTVGQAVLNSSGGLLKVKQTFVSSNPQTLSIVLIGTGF